jgi:hypothetical protein
MANHVAQMRSLLDRIERERAARLETAPKLPPAEGKLARTIADIVDYLMPALRPCEAAVYLYLFRHSIVKTGRPFVRASQSRLRVSVATSVYAGSRRGGRGVAGTTLGQTIVRDTLLALNKIGAIRQAGRADHEGTPYRVILPDAIAACRLARRNLAKFKATAAAARLRDAKPTTDFYTMRENRLKIYRRDGYRCQYCGKALDRYSATLDHVRPVTAGGGHDFDNLVTVCRRCNASKNALPLGDFLAERAGKRMHPLTRAPRRAPSPAKGSGFIITPPRP